MSSPVKNCSVMVSVVDLNDEVLLKAEFSTLQLFLKNLYLFAQNVTVLSISEIMKRGIKFCIR